MNKKKLQQLICVGTLSCSIFSIIPTYALESKVVIQNRNETQYNNEIIKTIELDEDNDYLDPTPVIIESESFENLLRDYLEKDQDEPIFKSDLKKITYIYIDKEKYPGVELSHLNILENLNSIAISSNDYFNLSSLESLTNIKGLTLGKGNYDLEDIINTNIKELRLSSSTNVDFSKLANLDNIEYLNISEPYSNSQVGDLTYLSDMQALKKLDLDLVDTSTERMNEIFKLEELTSLRLINDGDSIMCIQGIDNLTKLESLSLDNFYNKYTFQLNQLESLRELSISNTKIDDTLFDSSNSFNILETINRVDSLSLTDGVITDVTPFRNKTYEYLNLAYNYIDLSLPENKLLADNTNFGHLYPQKNLRNIKNDNNLTVGVGETIKLNNIIGTFISYDREYKVNIVDDFEIYENRTDKNLITINKENMTIQGVEAGNTEMIVKIEGLKEGTCGYLKFNVTVEPDAVGTGTLNVSCKDENNKLIDYISENDMSFAPGTYKYYAPYSFSYDVVGENEKTFTIESGITSNLEFNYNKAMIEPCAKITVKHVDAQTGMEIASRDKYDFYEFSTVQVYSVNKIKGYTVKGDYIKDVVLTKDNNEQTVVFEYDSNSNSNGDAGNNGGTSGGGSTDENKPTETPDGGNGSIEGDKPTETPDGDNSQKPDETPDGDNDGNTEKPGETPGGDNNDNNEKPNETPDGGNNDNNEKPSETPEEDNSQKPDENPAILGSVTINYIDINTGKIFKTITKEGLSLSETHTYSGTVESGYTLYDNESKTVSLSEEDKYKTITFKYIKNDSAATLGQDRLKEMYDSGAGFTAYTTSGSIKANKSFLKYVLDNHAEELIIDLNDDMSNKNIIDNLSKAYRFNIVTKFNLASNLDTSDLEEEVTVNKNIDDKYNNKSVYVYKVLSDDGVEFIGEKIVKDGVVSFDTELAKPTNARTSLSSTDYFVTDVKLDASSEINSDSNGSTNNGTNNNTSNNGGTNTNTDNNIGVNNGNQNTSTENIPFAGGIGAGVTIVSAIGILLASIGLLKKKRK